METEIITEPLIKCGKTQTTIALPFFKKKPSLTVAILEIMKLSRRGLFVVLGVLVWIFLGWHIVPYVKDTIQNGQSLMASLSFRLLAIAILLIPINYGIETAKWHYLIFKKNANSYWLAYKSVLSGMALGILTPNRVGEPFARALMVPQGNYLNSATAALICSLSQQAATLLFGLIGAIILTNQFNYITSNLIWHIGVASVLLSLAITTLLLSPTLLRWIAHHHFTTKLMQSIRGIDSFSLKQVTTIQSISLIRYCIFITQYACILYAFGSSLPLLHIVSAVACIFLVGSIIPLPAIVDVGFKISLAILFLGTTLDNEKAATAASTTIWIMNIAIPSLIGTIFVISNAFDNKKLTD